MLIAPTEAVIRPTAALVAATAAAIASRAVLLSTASAAPASTSAAPDGHRLDGLLGALLDLGDERGDLLGRATGALGQLAHLVGDDGEALALLAGPGGLDGGVERQQVGLVGDVVDGLDDGADLVALGAELGDLDRGGFHGAA